MNQHAVYLCINIMQYKLLLQIQITYTDVKMNRTVTACQAHFLKLPPKKGLKEQAHSKAKLQSHIVIRTTIYTDFKKPFKCWIDLGWLPDTHPPSCSLTPPHQGDSRGK